MPLYPLDFGLEFLAYRLFVQHSQNQYQPLSHLLLTASSISPPPCISIEYGHLNERPRVAQRPAIPFPRGAPLIFPGPIITRSRARDLDATHGLHLHCSKVSQILQEAKVTSHIQDTKRTGTRSDLRSPLPVDRAECESECVSVRKGRMKDGGFMAREKSRYFHPVSRTSEILIFLLFSF